MPEYSNETLTALVEGIDKKIDEGFDGVHKRQDKTNGNIVENRKSITSLKVWRGFITGGLTILSIAIGYLIYFIKK